MEMLRQTRWAGGGSKARIRGANPIRQTRKTSPATFTTGRFKPRQSDLAEVTQGLEATEPGGLPPLLPLRQITPTQPGYPTALALAINFIAYCLFAMRLKERRFAARYGNPFDRYRAEVPYILPRVMPKDSPDAQ